MIFSNSISKLFGAVADKKFPKFIQNRINRSYVKLMGVDLSEFKSEYDSLNELFTRELQREREFDKSENIFISPVDSYITESNRLDLDRALQIKGRDYSIKELLSDRVNYLDRVLDGEYINFYLSPKDYHRYHIPIDLKVKKVIHIAGKLYPVNLKYLNKVPNLFIENERVILECISNSGKVLYLVLVGALNVGAMTLSFESRVQTNREPNSVNIFEYENLELKKGECFGYFQMGSTVVALFERGSFKPEQNLTNSSVKFGDSLGDIS